MPIAIFVMFHVYLRSQVSYSLWEISLLGAPLPCRAEALIPAIVGINVFVAGVFISEGSRD
jgi:hypothetical protein